LDALPFYISIKKQKEVIFMQFLSAQPWCNLEVLSINRLPSRAHFLTATGQDKALQGQFDRAQTLNGTWDFHYTDHTPIDEQAFVDKRNSLSFDTIQVPRSFQMAGYGPMLYTDEDYPFPIDPPYVPAQNPTGVYRRNFSYAPDGDSLILRLEGAESCVSVYVNGAFVGYTQGSRLPSEFDVTDYCVAGENELLLIVRMYCDGTYLEDQDMWWMGGIIRDVLLLKRPVEDRISDIHVKADYDHKTGNGILLVTSDNAQFRLFDSEGMELVSDDCGTEHTLPVKPWNAEQPNLYTLLVYTDTEAARLKVGFRRVEIVKGELRLNGKRLMMRGINRHEFSPVNGRYASVEDTLKDMRMMKEAHINAIRTAHYPNAPYFYELCDELGFYVMDEADLETHGFEIEQEPARLATDPAWKDAFVERAERMYMRDKNYACVIMWSLGNESFRGENFGAMYDYLHSVDDRPVHYEGDISYKYSDVISTMYTTPAKLFEHDAAGHEKPAILCEFGHAMGNGPGSLKEYRDAIEGSKSIQGYFVWEWRNHGILKDGVYLHGGDFDSPYHTGNFCMDGLLNSDWTPTPGYYSYKKMNEPLRLKLDKDTLKVKSVLDFRSAKNVEVKATLLYEGEEVKTASQTIKKIKPGEKVKVKLQEELFHHPENGLYTLRLELLEKGFNLADETFVLKEYAPSKKAKEAVPGWQKVGDFYVLEGDTYSYKVSLVDGRLYDYKVNEQTLLEKGPMLSLFRPTNDNDKRRRDRWKRLNLHSMVPAVHYAKVEGDTLSLGGHYGANARIWWVPFEVKYTALSGSKIRVQLSGRFAGCFGEGRDDFIPRIGTDSVAPESFSHVTFLGDGPGESYPDSRFHCHYGWHSLPVDEMAFGYDCPQEAGNRTGCHVSALTGADGKGVAFVSRKPCDTQASFHTAKDIDDAAHPCNLIKRDKVFWRFDYRQGGLGSNSCGPEPLEKYTVRLLPFEMDWVIAPITSGTLTDDAKKAWDNLC
jgi:beta-galactosidase/beta-glucuronidase